MAKKRFRRRHRGGGGGGGARAEAPRPAPPPQRSEEGREGELDVVESTNGERNGDSKPPAGSVSEGLVAEKIAFGEGEIVIYRRVEKKSCSRYMLKDMFD